MANSLSVSGQAPATGVTTFANEACDAVMVNASYVDSAVAVPQPDLQDLKYYFGRPRLIRRGTFAFASRANQFSYDVSVANFQTAFPQWTNRLSGAYGIRFTTCFRMQVAATAFHQGLIAMSFQYGATPFSNYEYRRGAAPQTATNLGHVRLDISEGTMCELKVPFVYELEHMPILGTDYLSGNLGNMCINTVLPVISVAGLNPPSYEVYVWLEDIQLFGADNAATTTITLQSGEFSAAAKVVGKGNVMVDEMRRTKVVSGVLDRGAKIAGFVATAVPNLAFVAGPTAWALDLASGVAKYFGFSRPTVQEPPKRFVRAAYAGEGNVDLPMEGFTIGPMQSNTLAFDAQVGGTTTDEMSLSFLTSQFSQICVGQVSTTDTHGLAVYATPARLSALWFRAPTLGAPYCNIPHYNSTNSVTGNTIMFATVSYVGSFFRAWRGGLVFRFTFAKTKFHGGRYMVSFNPLVTLNTENSALATVEGPEFTGGLVQPYGYSKIIDLKDGNVFEFLVPYLSEVPYVTFDSSIGSLSMVCMDPLQASSSVTTVVPFLVEVAGDSDFQLADYAGPKFLPYDNPSFIVQSGEFHAVGTATNTDVSALVVSASKDPSQSTIGERLTSVKQLIQIPSYTTFTVAGATTSVIWVPPWWYYAGTAQIIAGGGGTPLNPAIVYSGCSFAAPCLARMYTFARGGSDIHIYNTGATGNFISTIDQLPNPLTTAVSTPTTIQGRSNTSAAPKMLTMGDSPLHARFPAYQKTMRVRHAAYLTGTPLTRSPSLNPGAVSSNLHITRVRLQNISGGTTTTAAIGYAAADDATLHQFIGPPPVIVPNVLNANSLFPDWYGA